ncbi:type II toxin-antitoxin system RelE family toxin [Enterococcus sp. AZ196]|uniref:type II toxin-antitoxin system RelE family toxin n=1 Tax=Enterococcus sp. AZ196 TaxID=2774659 RepID=UPI003D28B577
MLQFKELILLLRNKSKSKGLSANRTGQWRYRIGNYRVIVNINDNELIVLTLEVGHRREIY